MLKHDSQQPVKYFESQKRLKIMADFSSGSFVKRQIINKIKISWVHSLHCWIQYSLPHPLHILANVVGFPVFHACRKFAYSEIKTCHHICDAQKYCLGSCLVCFETQMKYKKKNSVCVFHSLKKITSLMIIMIKTSGHQKTLNRHGGWR